MTKRELELVRRAAELSRRERELAARTEEAAARAAALDARAEDLVARADEFDARAEELARRADKLEERTGRRRSAEVPARRPAPSPSDVAALPQRPGRWNLDELVRIVEECGSAFPDRQDEWQSYLFFLRSHVEPDGTVPASFDWLIGEQFADLVAAAS